MSKQNIPKSSPTPQIPKPSLPDRGGHDGFNKGLPTFQNPPPPPPPKPKS